MKSSSAVIEPEFSYIVLVDKIPPTGIEHVLEAKPTERDGLAKRFDLNQLSKLSAKLTLEPARAGEAILVTGKMIADVVQNCVITLEPLSSHIEHDINVLFALPENLKDIDDAMTLDLAEDVEPIMNGQIDLGEILAQNLGVSLNPYPKKEGASLPHVQVEVGPVTTNPFIKLVDLKKKPKD